MPTPPPPQGAPPFPPYGPLPPGMPGPLFLQPSNAPLAIASLICSIAGFVGFPVLGWIAGVVLGHVALGQIASQPYRYTGRGLALAGLITGYIGLGLVALVIIAALILIPLQIHTTSVPGN